MKEADYQGALQSKIPHNCWCQWQLLEELPVYCCVGQMALKAVV